MRGLVLGGFMGVGKSTVGRLLAARHGVPFVDLDEVLTRRFGPIANQFASDTRWGTASNNSLMDTCHKRTKVTSSQRCRLRPRDNCLLLLLVGIRDDRQMGWSA